MESLAKIVNGVLPFNYYDKVLHLRYSLSLRLDAYVFLIAFPRLSGKVFGSMFIFFHLLAASNVPSLSNKSFVLKLILQNLPAFSTLICLSLRLRFLHRSQG